MEQKLKIWVQKNAIVLAWSVIIILGVLIRFLFRKFLSGDAETYLIPWYYEIKSGGGIKSLGEQVGNYNLIYQFFIALFTYIPANPLTMYKVFSCIFDVVLAVLTVIYTRNIWKIGTWKEYMAFTCVFLSPIVVFNSSLWGQCDSIYAGFCIATLYLLFRERFWLAMISLGIAFSFKLQTIFILPFIIVYYITNKKFSIKHIGGTILSIVVLAIPGCISGRSIIEVFTVYKIQVTEYSKKLFFNYPGFSNWFLDRNVTDENTTYVKVLCILMAIVVLGCIAVWVLHTNIEMTEYNFTYVAFLMTYASVLFMPEMHERYGYVYEILAILIAIYDIRTAFGCIALQLCSIVTYSSYLFGYPYDSRILTGFNFGIYIMYFAYYVWKQQKNKNNVNEEREDEKGEYECSD